MLFSKTRGIFSFGAVREDFGSLWAGRNNGLLRSCLLRTGLFRTGLFVTDLFGTGLFGMGLLGTGLFGTGLFRMGLVGTGFFRTGFFRMGLFGTGLFGTGLFETYFFISYIIELYFHSLAVLSFCHSCICPPHSSLAQQLEREVPGQETTSINCLRHYFDSKANQTPDFPHARPGQC